VIGWRPNVVDGLADKRYVKAIFGTTKSDDPKPTPGTIRTRDHKRRLAEAWDKFLAEHPELSEGHDDYYGRPDLNNRMRPGKSWRGDDKARTRRSSRPRGRPSSEMQEPDGRPLRSSRAVDVSSDIDKLMKDAQARAAVFEESDDDVRASLDALAVVSGDGDGDGPDLLGVGGTGHRLDGTVGEHVVFSPAKAPHRLEWCEVCAQPLPLEWKQSPCEFPDSPMVHWEFPDFPMSDAEHCHCNSCLSEPNWGQGRPRYCSPKCEVKMDNAMDRARRRARCPDPAVTFDLYRVYLAPVGRLYRSPVSWNGETLLFRSEVERIVQRWPTKVEGYGFAPVQDRAERLATTKVELGIRARQRKLDDALYRSDESHIGMWWVSRHTSEKETHHTRPR
jgi:hypothetical protein